MRLITVAIHTYDRALRLKQRFEAEGIPTLLQNVNLESPAISPGVRVRIYENDLPLALRIIESPETFLNEDVDSKQSHHYILVPVDFSKRSLQAAAIAFYLAKQHNAKVLFFHTFMSPYPAGRMQLADALNFDLSESEAQQQLLQTANTQMQHFTARINALVDDGILDKIPYDTKVCEGVPEDAIVEYAKINPPYCIIMGTRSARQKAMDLIGSVTSEVLEKCKFSVITVPEVYDDVNHPESLEKILYFSNLDAEDILALDTMARIFKQDNGHTPTVTLMPALAKKRAFERAPQASIENLIDYCRTNFKDFKFESTKGKDISADNINDIVKDYDLVVVPNRRKSAIARLLKPGLANEILMRTDASMLVIRV